MRYMQFCAPQFKKIAKVPKCLEKRAKCLQRKATKLVKGLEGMSCEQELVFV